MHTNFSRYFFEGFQCFDDNSGRVVVQIKGAQVFQGGDLDGQIKWSLTNANGDIIRRNWVQILESQFNNSINQGGGPPFDYGVVDLAIEILGLPEGSYTFYFEDANGCTEEKQITIEKSVPITATLGVTWMVAVDNSFVMEKQMVNYLPAGLYLVVGLYSGIHIQMKLITDERFWTI